MNAPRLRLRLSPFALAAALLAAGASVPAAALDGASLYGRGTLFLDAMGFRYGDGPFSSRISSRLRFEFLDRPGSGWTLSLDARGRMDPGEEGTDRVLLYDARLSYDKPGSPFSLALGQMNLYDSAGIGRLLGGLAGLKVGSAVLLGSYAGLEPGLDVGRLDSKHLKFGLFARYRGKQGRSLSLSLNRVLYDGRTERSFLFTGGLLPVGRFVVLFGNAEYELGSAVASADRLSRLFFNVRISPAPFLDLSAFYSSGRGLDFHKFQLETSRDPSLGPADIDRYYYSLQYGIRVDIKPTSMLRLFLARQESEQKDEAIRNHTWRLGGSWTDLLGTGLTLYGGYSRHRGPFSESDSFTFSLDKTFGPLSWTWSFSNTYNGLRWASTGDAPQLIRLQDSPTMGSQAMVTISRNLAVSAEFELVLRKEAAEQLGLLRVILRY
jgi:hypothetical protein